ncbi:hypothetical protein Y1Q_0021400 [Alligator mississippiensis]|uniref:Uncharacterized protein n=1 Tax=Alligator mississippiensis TaxID=8496 RepID=A0A151P9M9_ALLMI|nr:hypothetical protein Y1Q_0021400 [Alligator mississippiensis]
MGEKRRNCKVPQVLYKYRNKYGALPKEIKGHQFTRNERNGVAKFNSIGKELPAGKKKNCDTSCLLLLWEGVHQANI